MWQCEQTLNNLLTKTFNNEKLYAQVSPDRSVGSVLRLRSRSAAKELVYPSWRGQHDNWESVCALGGFEYAGATKTNLAIQGLFEKVDGDALVAAGYEKVDWGKALVANEEDYYNKFFNGYDYETAPIYMWPFTPNVVATGGFTNGYGFMN